MPNRDLLSQDELDALMEGVGNGRVVVGRGQSAGEVLAYDLASPENVIACIQPALNTVQMRFVHQLGLGFYELLRRDLPLTPVEVHAEPYQDFVARLHPPCSVNVIGLSPMAGPGLILFDHPLVFSLVGAWYGGQGTQYSETDRLEFTAAELRMVQRLNALCAKALVSAWQPYLPVRWTQHASEISPHLVTAIHPGELLIVFGIDLMLDGTLGTLRVALPSSMFEPVRGTLLAALAREHPLRDERLQRLLEEGVRDAQVQVSCVLAELEVSVNDLLNLQVGDTIPVDLPDQARLEVDGVRLLAGHFGDTQGWRALQIDRWLVSLPETFELPSAERALKPVGRDKAPTKAERKP
ncbi:FliM/FliN family flagellar motor switch protein [Plasticicumulans sp.]|uniref:flagellar motor switch protein FliM n=1 Tax=Plasticicumulans sp. TaxID=2307179 RepID=UPI002C51B14F|nr:FliM/FliN family flagellar motor switch protein [Plasticicumulans sp.]HNM44022.1 FliM/FliN family flagellar motor switch protein [Plasticicumulans sp.]